MVSYARQGTATVEVGPGGQEFIVYEDIVCSVSPSFVRSSSRVKRCSMVCRHQRSIEFRIQLLTGNKTLGDYNIVDVCTSRTRSSHNYRNFFWTLLISLP